MAKISSELRLIISRKFGSKETWDLDVLLNALKSVLEARERCNAVFGRRGCLNLRTQAVCRVSSLFLCIILFVNTYLLYYLFNFSQVK